MIPRIIHYCWFGRGEYESFENTNADYKQMIDNLRTYSLMNYLLDKQHRDATQEELAKVD